MPYHGSHLDFGVQDEIISSNSGQKLNSPPKSLKKVLLSSSVLQLSQIRELCAFSDGHLGFLNRKTS